MKNPYDVLGVDRKADDADIKRAFRKLAKELHPDANPGDDAAAERFRDVKAAYELLSDPEGRMEYDLGGWRRGYADGFGAGSRGGAPGDGDGDHPWDREEVYDWSDKTGERPIDLHGDIAGARRGRVFGAASTSLYLPGEALIHKFKVTAEEALTGVPQKRIDLPTGVMVEVELPAGLKSGDEIVLEGLGFPGFGGAPNGNLTLIVDIAAPPQLATPE